MNTSIDLVWESKYSQGHAELYPWDSVVSFIFREHPKNKPRKEVFILEVGCGAGNNLWFSAREGFRVFGIDGSKSAIEFAKKIFADDGLIGSFELGDYTRLPYEDNFFDLVIDRSSLTCCDFDSARAAVSEVHRVMRVGAKFMFNPYSDSSSSFASGVKSSNGIVRDISAGSMIGVGGICFYGRQHVISILNKFKIESLRHIQEAEVLSPAVMMHSEWLAVAEKDF